MPLQHSSSKQAFKNNVRTLMGEIGTSPHVKSAKQALAIAYSERRRNRALGGQTPWFVRNAARQMIHSGPIVSTVPGRTDRHDMNVAAGSYVVPAETVSHLGQSNSMAGLRVLGNMFGPSGPYGSGNVMHMSRPPAAPHLFRGMSDTGGARGGDGFGEPVPIRSAGGEFVIRPEVVMRIGGGDIKRGHAILDKWVMSMRKDHIKTLKHLAPPAKS